MAFIASQVRARRIHYYSWDKWYALLIALQGIGRSCIVPQNLTAISCITAYSAKFLSKKGKTSQVSEVGVKASMLMHHNSRDCIVCQGIHLESSRYP